MIFRQCDLVETPWKNGGGITRNIAKEQDKTGTLWRLSMADVDGDGQVSVADFLEILALYGTVC